METDLFSEIKVGGRICLLPKDVAYFEADLNYTIIHYQTGKPKIVATTMGHIQDRIKNKNAFVRPNRKYLINLDYINSLEIYGLHLQNDLHVNISRRRKLAVIPIVESYLEKNR
jgi:DNA-binding LytR/AlgR family response regulator